MPERDRAPVRVDVFGIVGHAELPQRRQALRGERLVELDDVHLPDREAALFQDVLRRRCRADSHDARLDAGHGPADNACQRLELVLLRGRCRCNNHGAGAVVDARGIACRDGAVSAHDGFQFCEPFDRRSRPGVLVRVDDDVVTAPLRNRHGNNLVPENAGVDRRLGALLTAQRECVLVGAGHEESIGHVLGRFGHRVDAVLLFDLPVDKAPAQRRVVELGIAAVRCRLLRHDERRT